MFEVDPILDAAKPGQGEGNQSPREIRLDKRLVAKYLIIKDFIIFFKRFFN